MKIENLFEGMELKSYRHLCEELGIKPKGGKGKRYQMKEIERFVKISKGKGYRLIINEVYDTPLPKEDGRGDVFGQMIQLLITDHLIEQNKEVNIVTINSLMRDISMVNHNYNYSRNNIKKVSKHIHLDEKFMYEFFNTTQSNFVSAIQTAIDNLKKRLVIDYDRVLMICTKENKHREASEKDKIFIKESEKTVLNKLNEIRMREYENVTDEIKNKPYKTVNDVMFTKDWQRFKSELKVLLHKNSNINYTYRAYKILVVKKFINNEQNEMLIEYLSDLEKINQKNKLNSFLCTSLLDNAINRQKKARVANIRDEKVNNELVRIRANFNYEKNFHKMITLMIDKKTQTNIESDINMNNRAKVDDAVNKALEDMGGLFGQ